ncbi:hypothetical protein MRX96_052117, partial [Rhipicephalus microplus]
PILPEKIENRDIGISSERTTETESSKTDYIIGAITINMFRFFSCVVSPQNTRIACDFVTAFRYGYSMSSVTFGQKVFTPKPPDKGSFPLDHEGECKQGVLKYLLCLKDHDGSAEPCRHLAKDYLECRMNR